MTTDGSCRCGHVYEAHEHYRKGSDCGVCGRDVCAKFRLAPLQPVPTLGQPTSSASSFSTESATAETA